MSPWPNIISLSRAAAAVGLLFTAVFSGPFWALYLWCGVSDMIDGPLARRLGAESRAGAAIDSIADFVFVAIACVRIIPALAIHIWLWLIVGAAAVSQLVRMCCLFFRRGGWDGLHDSTNRIVGLALYLATFISYIADVTPW